MLKLREGFLAAVKTGDVAEAEKAFKHAERSSWAAARVLTGHRFGDSFETHRDQQSQRRSSKNSLTSPPST